MMFYSAESKNGGKFSRRQAFRIALSED